uniref:Endonuclease/exonuclease/phosphatase domain-containing protein n=1 Tax=Photinus pyralis TaxID=7054 RepID=A0A1Y1NEK0_PHOPY
MSPNRVIQNCNDSLNIMHINVQCLRNKCLELESIAHAHDYDVLCINEHWLRKEEIEVLSIQGYRVVTSFCRSSKIHGGVCILIKNSYKCTPLNLLGLSKEVNFEVVGLKYHNIEIVSIYRSPSGDFDIFMEQLLHMLETLNFRKLIIITGDFNVKFNTKDEQAHQLCNIFLTFGLKQSVFENTRMQSCLDNIFTNIPDFSVTVFDTYFSDHNAVGFTLGITSHKDCSGNNGRITYRPITNIGLFRMYNILEYVNWEFISDERIDSETKFDMFVKLFSETIVTTFPLKCRLATSTSREVNWFTDSLKQLRSTLQLCSDMLKSNSSLVTKEMLRNVKLRYKNELSKAKKMTNDKFIKKTLKIR